MKSTKKPRQWLIWTILGLVLTTGIIAYATLSPIWNKPLGASLEMPTGTPTVQPTIEPSSTLEVYPGLQVTTTTLASTVVPTEIAIPTATPTLQTYCGGPQVMYILGIGTDNRDDNYDYGLSDVMRVARVDFTEPSVTVLSFPRDLWVEIPDISSHYGIDHGKLNQAYFYGGSVMGYYDGPGEGAGLLARTIALNFGLTADHYGAVNMQTFVKIVDAVGGIDIYLEQPVDGTPIDDTTEDMGYFPSGEQHLDGIHALKLSRVRKRYNDLTRADNQTLVLCALKKKLTSAEMITKIPDLITAFQGSVQTDLSPAQLSQLACLAPMLNGDNLTFLSFPDDIFSPSRAYDPVHKIRTFVYDVDFDVMRDYVSQFMDGTWDTSAEEGTGTSCE